jgi:hypothetical protein
MRTVTLAITTAIFTGGLATLTTGTAVAGENCVTKVEFASVSDGMTRAQVARIFDTDGRQTARVSSNGHVYSLRAYLPCPKSSSVSVSFKDGRVFAKSAHWGLAGVPQGTPLPGMFAGDAIR